MIPHNHINYIISSMSIKYSCQGLFLLRGGGKDRRPGWLGVMETRCQVSGVWGRGSETIRLGYYEAGKFGGE